MKLTPVSELRNDCINSEPIDYDWSAHEAGEDWQSWEAEECECGELVVSSCGYGVCPECDKEVYVGDGPMMNYYYPIPKLVDDPSDAAAKLYPLCLALVTFDENEWGLALTGGGMDLSWEICEAHMRLGYLPPLHFAGLPRMGGMGATDHNLWIVDGVKRTTEIAVRWAQGAAEGVERIREWLHEEDQRNAARRTRSRATAKTARPS